MTQHEIDQIANDILTVCTTGIVGYIVIALVLLATGGLR